jgi:hypothetical protein
MDFGTVAASFAAGPAAADASLAARLLLVRNSLGTRLVLSVSLSLVGKLIELLSVTMPLLESSQ